MFNPGYQISKSVCFNTSKYLQTSPEYRFKGTFQDSIKKRSEKNLQNVARNSHPREYQRIIPTKYVVTRKDQLFWLNLIQFFPSEKKVKCSIKVTLFISMTSLFAHKVAQPTKWRFLPKNLSQLVIFVIGLAFTWV